MFSIFFSIFSFYNTEYWRVTNKVQILFSVLLGRKMVSKDHIVYTVKSPTIAISSFFMTYTS